MKTFLTICFCILFAAPAFSQTFEPKGNFKIKDDEAVRHFQLLNDGKTLLLVGDENAVFWDIQSKKVSDSAAFEDNFSINFGAMSPDGRKLLSLEKGIYYYKPDRSPAFIFDSQSGKKILKFDEKVGYGFWSENGKVLVTADGCIYPTYVCEQKQTTFTFRDGDSLEKSSSVVVERFSRFFLSRDGKRFFTSSKIKNKGKSFYNLKLWDTRTGQLEQNLLNDEYHIVSGNLVISENKNLIGVVAESKSDKNNRTVFVWNIAGNALAKYQIKPAEKITSDDLIFSLDEKLIALDINDKVQFYEILSGKKFSESGKERIPDLWIADNRVVIYRNDDTLRAYQTGSEEPIYFKTLAYKSENVMTYPETMETVTIDKTVIRPNADGKIFLLASNQHLKIFESESGKLIQTLVKPRKISDVSLLGKPLDEIDELLKIEDGRYVLSDAVWSEDYRYILGKSYKGDSVYIWERKN